MSNKKANIISMSLPPETQEKLSNKAEQWTKGTGKKGNVSKVVRDLVDKYLDSLYEDEVLAVNVEADVKERLNVYAQQKNVPTSKVVRDLVEKYLVTETDQIPVILKIPTRLVSEPAELSAWLESKMAAIVKALTA